MGLRYNTYLNGNKIYGCHNCKAHLADHDDILSRVSSALLLALLLRLHSSPARLLLRLFAITCVVYI